MLTRVDGEAQSFDFAAGCEDDALLAPPGSDPEVQVEEHIDVVKDRIAASNARDWAKWQSLHTDDATRTSPDLEAPLEGADAMRAAIEELTGTFPDYHLELVEAFGEGDRLVARIHARGTMTGPISFGSIEIPPTGRAFEQDWVGMLTFEGDKISAIDEFYDNYGTMVQLGLAQ
jgi:ketosteroid isomerase-like protein